MMMVRRPYAGLGAALLAAFSLQAPFAHVHPDDPDHPHDHATALSHTHLPSFHDDLSEQPEWEASDHDERTIYLEWAPTAAPRIVVHYAETSSIISFQPTYGEVGLQPEFAPCSHSPPRLGRLPARSPPV
jgi:hypothetical protein